MRAEEFSKNILGVDPQIRFAGIMEKSGHLYAGGMREGKEEYLKYVPDGLHPDPEGASKIIAPYVVEKLIEGK